MRKKSRQLVYPSCFLNVWEKEGGGQSNSLRISWNSDGCDF